MAYHAKEEKEQKKAGSGGQPGCGGIKCHTTIGLCQTPVDTVGINRTARVGYVVGRLLLARSYVLRTVIALHSFHVRP